MVRTLVSLSRDAWLDDHILVVLQYMSLDDLIPHDSDLYSVASLRASWVACGH